MAKVLWEAYAGDWELNFRGDINAEIKRTQELLDSIPTDKVIKFPVADGYAYYFVKSLTPLVLQHIPYGDAWHANPILIRGLRRKDVEKMIEAERTLGEIFR